MIGVMISSLVFGTILFAYVVGIRLNVTASIPIGMYWVTRYHTTDALSRGTLVLACPPLAAARIARQRQYLIRGSCPGDVMPLGKSIAAIPNDTVVITSNEIVVSGVSLAASHTRIDDAQHRPLPHVPDGRYIVPPHTVWLAGYTANSWDSRYFGVVYHDAIRGILHPVWTIPTMRAP